MYLCVNTYLSPHNWSKVCNLNCKIKKNVKKIFFLAQWGGKVRNRRCRLLESVCSLSFTKFKESFYENGNNQVCFSA